MVAHTSTGFGVLVTVGVRVGTSVLVAVTLTGMGMVAVGGLGVSVYCTGLEFVSVGVEVSTIGVFPVSNAGLIALDMISA